MGESPRRGRDSFRVIALISSFNEGDVISPVIQHLVENGVDVYLLDNHSTDDTIAQASRWLGRGLLQIETFPAADDPRYGAAANRYDWTAILRRKEELARTLEADWFLHHDADEIRESPWDGISLKDAIRFADRLNYNCIDFRIFEFPPVDNGFRSGMDLKTYFTRSREAGGHDQLQLKCWKAQPGPVSLVHFGGHDVEFEGRRVFPIQFLLRHYPIRSQQHGERKVFEERKKRFVAEERAKSWHIQYDHIHDQAYSFVADPETLRPFDLARARLNTMLENREAIEQKKARELALGEVTGKLGALEQQLTVDTAEFANKNREHATHILGLELKAGVLEGQLEATTNSIIRREAEHQAHISQLEKRAAEVEAHLTSSSNALNALQASNAALESELLRTRGVVHKITTSKTWRLAEPAGRFILTLGFLRRNPREAQESDPASPARASSSSRTDRVISRLRRQKLRLGSGGAIARTLVPPVEALEVWLSHGLREVIIRSRMRLREISRPAVGKLPDVRRAASPETSVSDVKLIAFYLPQYHPIPENDEAWGKGFTEWTNVTRARPLFDGHFQPHLPADLGFYDLRVAETREAQGRLARSYGIHGFCYYYYWFDRRRLLSRPLDEMLQSGTPDFPFCICWANEPWSRRWDGSEHEIIASQDYQDGYADRFIDDVIPILRDPRYIRVGGLPLLIVYRLDHLPDPAAAAAKWREACRREGVGEICLAAMGTYGTTDPRPFGFDISIEFPPHNLTIVPTIENQLSGLHKEFTGRVFDYATCADAELTRRPIYPQFRGLMTSWDNTARRGDSAMLFHNASPTAYESWLRRLLDLASGASAPYSPFVFINAWNEWAEGAHLEPDQKYGHGYLEATASALLSHTYQNLFERGFQRSDGAKLDVAIVIPVHNHVDVTLACLESLARHQSRWRFEVIVVDDGSEDLTRRFLNSIPGLRYIRSQSNQGFIRSCNAGASAARADYIVLLNNDTIVHDGWLDELRGTFDHWPSAGLVGSKLVWPSGRIQECGSLIYRDGSAENYGREGDPDDPRYCFARESDYVTGAAIMIERGLFERLGGFDEMYVPAYYEDVDLAFRVRQAGLRVLVNPLAVVTHLEGGTAGTDVGVGAKRYQVVNQQKFFDRWRHVLADYPERDGRSRKAKRDERVLVIDWTVPRPDRDAGSVRMSAILQILKRLDYHVTFVSRDGSYDATYASPLERIGVEVLRQPYIGSVREYLQAEGKTFGHVIVSRRDVAAMHMADVKAFCQGARVIFDTVDLHFIREMRQRDVEGKGAVALSAQPDDTRELDCIKTADVTLVVSDYERDVLRNMFKNIDVRVVSIIHQPEPTPRAFKERTGLLFVGYFVHTPNADAVRWFLREVLPHIRIQDPHFCVHIVGSDPPADILAMASDRVKIHGYVADVEALFDSCKMSIAPLRYGAGVKGKIGQSLALGVPCVTTSIGAEGMSLIDGTSAMIADTATEFAERIEQLYDDEKLWSRLRDRGLDVIAQHMSMTAAQRELEQVFAAKDHETVRQ